MTSSSPRIDISGDESQILCTQEDAISWFSALNEEFGVTVSGLGDSSFTINFVSQGKNTKHHLIHIFIHAVLHLLGFNHEEQSSAERMESIEVNILKKIGVADPY